MTEELHEFEKAGYGPGPYQEMDVKEDTGLSFCCDNCGQKGLRYKFELLSSTGQLFGVGSECIRKADPQQWLELKQKYGADKNVSMKQVAKRRVWERGVELRDQYLSQTSDPDASARQLSTFNAETRNFAVPYEEVSRKRQGTFEKGIKQLEVCLNAAQKKWDLIAEIRMAVQSNPLMIPKMGDRFQALAWHIAENSGKTDRLKKASFVALRIVINEIDVLTARIAA